MAREVPRNGKNSVIEEYYRDAQRGRDVRTSECGGRTGEGAAYGRSRRTSGMARGVKIIKKVRAISTHVTVEVAKHMRTSDPKREAIETVCRQRTDEAVEELKQLQQQVRQGAELEQWVATVMLSLGCSQRHEFVESLTELIRVFDVVQQVTVGEGGRIDDIVEKCRSVTALENQLMMLQEKLRSYDAQLAELQALRKRCENQEKELEKLRQHQRSPVDMEIDGEKPGKSGNKRTVPSFGEAMQYLNRLHSGLLQHKGSSLQTGGQRHASELELRSVDANSSCSQPGAPKRETGRLSFCTDSDVSECQSSRGRREVAREGASAQKGDDPVARYMRHMTLPEVQPYSGQDSNYGFVRFLEDFQLKYPRTNWTDAELCTLFRSKLVGKARTLYESALPSYEKDGGYDALIEAMMRECKAEQRTIKVVALGRLKRLKKRDGQTVSDFCVETGLLENLTPKKSRNGSERVLRCVTNVAKQDIWLANVRKRKYLPKPGSSLSTRVRGGCCITAEERARGSSQRPQTEKSPLFGKKMTVELELLGIKARGLLDTGSEITILPGKVLLRAKRAGFDIDRALVEHEIDQTKRVYDASGSAMQFVAVLEVPIRDCSSGRKVSALVHVSRVKDDMVILGTNVLPMFGYQLTREGRPLDNPTKTETGAWLQEVVPTIPNPTVAKVARREYIAPGAMSWVQLTGCDKDADWLLDSGIQLIHSGVCHVKKDGPVEVPVINRSSAPVVLKEGEPVGQWKEYQTEWIEASAKDIPTDMLTLETRRLSAQQRLMKLKQFLKENRKERKLPARAAKEFDVVDEMNCLHGCFRCQGQPLPILEGVPQLDVSKCHCSASIVAGDLISTLVQPAAAHRVDCACLEGARVIAIWQGCGTLSEEDRLGWRISTRTTWQVAREAVGAEHRKMVIVVPDCLHRLKQVGSQLRDTKIFYYKQFRDIHLRKTELFDDQLGHVIIVLPPTEPKPGSWLSLVAAQAMWLQCGCRVYLVAGPRPQDLNSWYRVAIQARSHLNGFLEDHMELIPQVVDKLVAENGLIDPTAPSYAVAVLDNETSWLPERHVRLFYHYLSRHLAQNVSLEPYLRKSVPVKALFLCRLESRRKRREGVVTPP
ncbi:hypothetical protein COOONC_18792 [Cooperia oncophora]